MSDARHDNPPRGKARPGWHSVLVEFDFDPDLGMSRLAWSSDVEVLIDNGEVIDWRVPELPPHKLAALAVLLGPDDTPSPDELKALSAALVVTIHELLDDAARENGLL